MLPSSVASPRPPALLQPPPSLHAPQATTHRGAQPRSWPLAFLQSPCSRPSRAPAGRGRSQRSSPETPAPCRSTCQAVEARTHQALHFFIYLVAGAGERRLNFKGWFCAGKQVLLKSPVSLSRHCYQGESFGSGGCSPAPWHTSAWGWGCCSACGRVLVLLLCLVSGERTSSPGWWLLPPWCSGYGCRCNPASEDATRRLAPGGAPWPPPGWVVGAVGTA